MAKQRWSFLEKGDLVDIVAPAGRPKPKTLEGLQDFLSSWGLRGRLAPNALGSDLLCAHNASQRFQNLKAALQAPDSKMIWCLRGGYGSLQLLPFLRKMKPVNNKCFLGFSDITSLHTFLVQSWGWSTLHGCNIDRFALGQASAGEVRRFRQILFGKKQELQYGLKPLNAAAEKTRHITGPLIGGNLITLQSSFGTAFEMKTQGHILFLEEIGERAYKVDRVMQHMQQRGLFKGLRAIVLGQFTEGEEPDGRSLLPKYWRQYAKTQSVPVLKGIPSGHGNNQHAIPLGVRAELSLGPQALLKVGTGGQ